MPIEFNNDDDENNSTNNPFVPKIDKKDSTIDQDNNIESTSIKKSTEGFGIIDQNDEETGFSIGKPIENKSIIETDNNVVPPMVRDKEPGFSTINEAPNTFSDNASFGNTSEGGFGNMSDSQSLIEEGNNGKVSKKMIIIASILTVLVFAGATVFFINPSLFSSDSESSADSNSIVDQSENPTIMKPKPIIQKASTPASIATSTGANNATGGTSIVNTNTTTHSEILPSSTTGSISSSSGAQAVTPPLIKSSNKNDVVAQTNALFSPSPTRVIRDSDGEYSTSTGTSEAGFGTVRESVTTIRDISIQQYNPNADIEISGLLSSYHVNDRITFIIKALANSKSVTPTFSTDTFNGDMVITITIQKPNADTVSLEPNLVTQKYEIPVSLMKIGTHKIWVKINGFTKTSVSYIINQ